MARKSQAAGRGRPLPGPSEFDAHAETYQETLDQSLAFSGEGTGYYARLKAELLSSLARRGGDGRSQRVLDVGCGLGLVLEHLDPALFPNPTGTDVSEAVLARARGLVPGAGFVACGEEGDLPFPDGAFDLAFTACTLHHVPPAARPAFMRGLVRVTRPGGLVAVFEHNPLNPLTRAVVAGCQFDSSALLLGASEVRGLMRAAGLEPRAPHYYLFVPPRLRALHFLEGLLAWLPLGGQYLVVGRVPPS